MNFTGSQTLCSVIPLLLVVRSSPPTFQSRWVFDNGAEWPSSEPPTSQIAGRACDKVRLVRIKAREEEVRTRKGAHHADPSVTSLEHALSCRCEHAVSNFVSGS